MELKIEYLSVDELKPYENNARKHEQSDVNAIKASIEQFGFNDPIGIWKDNIIVEGHGRLIAAQELGMDKVPVIRLDELTDEQRRAYTLAHNKTTELSSWDFEKLEAELDEIELDMSEFGFGENSENEFSYIDDLMNNDFTSSAESDIFSVTFNFPIVEKEAVDAYIKANGKDIIADKILEVVRNA